QIFWKDVIGIKADDGVTRFICAQIITPRWYGAELTGKIAPCDRLHGNHRSKWNDHLARKAIMVLAPDLLNETAAQMPFQPSKCSVAARVRLSISVSSSL